jgi:hypothetical protein
MLTLFFEGILSYIDSIIPKGHHEADVRPPAVEEIRKLLDQCDLRLKALVLILLSSGCRIGALTKGQDYREPRYKDLHVFEMEVDRKKWHFASIKLYVGSAEEYTTFISSEAYQALIDYLRLRRTDGENIGSESPLIRDDWDKSVYKGRHKRDDVDINNPQPVAKRTLEVLLQIRWIRSGIRELQPGFKGYKKFKAAHGFRSFFTTKLQSAGMSEARIKLRGDARRTYGSYDRPPVEELAKSYAQYQKALFIDEKYVQSDTIAKQRQQLLEENKKLTERVKLLEGSKVDMERALAMISELNRKLEEIEQERIREKAAKLETANPISSSWGKEE